MISMLAEQIQVQVLRARCCCQTLVAPLVTALVMALALWALACGDGVNSTGSLFDDGVRITEFIIETAPPGLVKPIVVDSSAWRPTAVLPVPGQALEILGDYVVIFRNDTDVTLRLRYDLRFFDDDGFLVDNYIPPGQPIDLAPMVAVTQAGEFVLRAGADAARFGLHTMRVAVRLSLPEVEDSG